MPDTVEGNFSAGSPDSQFNNRIRHQGQSTNVSMWEGSARSSRDLRAEFFAGQFEYRLKDE